MQQEMDRMQKEKEHAKIKKSALKLRIAEVTATSAIENKGEAVMTKLDGLTPPSLEPASTAPIVASPQKVATPALSKVSVTNTLGGPDKLTATTGLADVLPPVPTFELGRSTLIMATATKTVPTVVPLTTAV